MKSKSLNDAQLIYQADIQFTGMIEYGIEMGEITTGGKSIPPGGARFDQVFDGKITGPKIKGIIRGTDYLNVRADGVFQLHLHGQIITEEGVNISLSSLGVSRQIEGEVQGQLRSAVTLYSVDPAYSWLNDHQLLAIGTFDPVNFQAHLNTYSV